MWLSKLMDDLEKQQDTSSMLLQALSRASFCSHQSIQTVVIVWKWPILGQIWRFFVLCHLEIWWITLKNNRAPLLCYFKFCASIFSHWAIQTVWKRQIQVKNNHFLFCVTLKFDGWPWKTTVHLFYAISSFVHHFITIGQTGVTVPKSKFGSNLAIFCPMWPWNLTFDLEKQ